MTDRDDALRRELGWTGPKETDYEPPTPKPEPAPPPKPPVPSRPPVDFVAPDRGPSPSAEEDDERAAPPSSRWAAPVPGPEPGPQGDQPDAPPPASYAERIRVDELMPRRRVLPSRGWRLALYKATFGLVNLGPSPDEIRQAELENKIKSVLRGHYKVGVMGKVASGRRPCPPASDPCSPSCATTTAWWPSTPIPRSASSAAGSTRRLRAPTGSWRPTSISRRSPTSAPGWATTPPAYSCWPGRPRPPAAAYWTQRSIGKRRRGWTATSRSRSSIAAPPWIPGHPGAAAGSRRAHRGVVTVDGRRGGGWSDAWTGWPPVD